MKIYDVAGYLIILAYMLACMYSAPAHLGPWIGMLIGGLYFIFCWFLAGLYLGNRSSRTRLQGVVRKGRHRCE
jgi:hypothetical protein